MKKGWLFFVPLLTGPRRVCMLLCFTVLCHAVHVLLYPFPRRDALTYLHILHRWNSAGSYAQVLTEFPKFGVLIFSFLPLKWAAQIGIPLYVASIVWMILMSAVSVYAFYKIVLLLTGDGSKAMWCGALLSVQPMILSYAGNLLRDTPYLMSALLLVLFFVESVQKRKWYFFLLTGVTLAMCLLSRFEAWELPVLFPAAAVFYAVKCRFSKREFWSWVLLAAAGFAVTVVCMFSAVDDLPLLGAKVKFLLLYFLPDWMGVR